MAEKEYIERDKAIDACFDGWNNNAHDCADNIRSIPAADVVPASDFRDCRNELCLKCGAYTQKHLGACDGCRWR